MLRVWILLLVLLSLLPGCGREQEPRRPHRPDAESPASRPATSGMPAEPEAALAWVRAAAQDPKELRGRLGAWPLDDDAFTFVTESQIALTWRLRLALQDLRITEACADLARLERDYEGQGESPQGESFDRRTLALAIFEQALRAARQAMAGTRPDPKRAALLLKTAEDLLQPSDATDRRRVTGLRHFLLAENVATLLSLLGIAWGADPSLPPTRGVIACADEFALGDLRFIDVLARWQRDGAHLMLIPVLRGQVRVGQRLLPAASRAAEEASFKSHAREGGLTPYEGTPLEGAALERLGLGRQEVLVLLHDEQGRILGRIAGVGPDLHPLDPAVQRLVSR